jgi:hypothetical protein
LARKEEMDFQEGRVFQALRETGAWLEASVQLAAQEIRAKRVTLD